MYAGSRPRAELALRPLADIGQRSLKVGAKPGSRAAALAGEPHVRWPQIPSLREAASVRVGAEPGAEVPPAQRAGNRVSAVDPAGPRPARKRRLGKGSSPLGDRRVKDASAGGKPVARPRSARRRRVAEGQVGTLAPGKAEGRAAPARRPQADPGAEARGGKERSDPAPLQAEGRKRLSIAA